MRGNGRIWLPGQVEEVKSNVLIRKNCGNNEHRGAETTKKTIAAKFCWNNISENVWDFLYGFIHCIITEAEEILRRSLSTV